MLLENFRKNTDAQIYIITTVIILFYLYVSTITLYKTSEVEYNIDMISENLKLELPYAITAAVISSNSYDKIGASILEVCAFFKDGFQHSKIHTELSTALYVDLESKKSLILVNCFDDSIEFYIGNEPAKKYILDSYTYLIANYTSSKPEKIEVVSDNYAGENNIDFSYNVSYAYFFRISDNINHYTFSSSGFS